MSRRCARCGLELSGTVLSGHCPHCLVRISLDFTRGLASDASVSDRLPRRFGEYELLGEIARGGMGVVYRARQAALKREVALKLTLSGQFASPAALARFRAEAQAAASLQHPNIVAIHDVGEEEGQPYFTMDLVEGENLANLVRRGPLPPRQAAQYVQTVAEAIHYAHGRGILHRDLKPSNVLIDIFDQPRITDFGLARQISDDSSLTASGQALGSPSYMAPEQTLRRQSEIGVWSDVYSLGALLYHLVAGRAPFAAATLAETLSQVVHHDPPSPRLLNPNVPADLETICLRCLEKDPIHRYASAEALAAELGRYLRDEPIQARPLSAAGNLWRFCRRHPAIAALSASVLLLLAVVTGGSVVAVSRITLARHAERLERQKAELANRDLREANVRLAETVSWLELQQAEDSFRVSDSAAGAAQLAAIVRRDPSNHIAASRLVSALVHRDWALPSGPPRRHQNRVEVACFSPDGQHVLSASWDRTAQIRDLETGSVTATAHHADRISSASYNSAGDRFVTASADGSARIWSATDGEPVSEPLRHDGEVYWAEFSGDGRLVLTASADKLVRIWDAADGSLVQELVHEGEVPAAHFSPDDERVMTGTAAGSVRIWSLGTGRAMHLAPHRDRVRTLAWSRDGRRVVTGGEDAIAHLSDPATGEAVGGPLAHGGLVLHALFSPDSRLLLTTSQDGMARLWDAETGQLAGQPMMHAGGVNYGAFSPDGGTIATAALDIATRLWSVDQRKPLYQPLRQLERTAQANFSPDGRHLVTASYDQMVQVWDIQPRRLGAREMRHEQDVTAATFSPNGEFVLSSSRDQTVRLWDGRTGEPQGEPMQQAASVLCAEFSPDGRRIVAALANGSARVLDVDTGLRVAGAIQHAGAVWSARFSPDGRRLVTASADRTARVWDALTGQPVTLPLKHDGEVRCAQFSHNSRFVVTASNDASARVWDANTGEPISPRLAHVDQVEWAEFSPDDQYAATASRDNTAAVWHIRTGKLAAPPLEHTRSVYRAVFSPDGLRLATASLDRTARVWDARTGQALTEPIKHDGSVACVSFSPDGQRLLTGSADGTVRLWDSRTGRPLTEPLATVDSVLNAAFDRTGQRIVTGTLFGRVRVFDAPPVPTPVPDWFPAFAEAVAGTRQGPRGNLELVPRLSPDMLARELAPSPEGGFYDALARWFLSPPATRAPTPF